MNHLCFSLQKFLRSNCDVMVLQADQTPCCPFRSLAVNQKVAEFHQQNGFYQQNEFADATSTAGLLVESEPLRQHRR